ncbi:hypothetical protein GH733_012277 [Mirounga leonina]|nr:hypothetical protein GH733_012277 [Mirounga leonina]
MPLPPCPQGSPWEPEPAVPASISAEGVGPEQSSPSLDKGLKYPPGPWRHSCCGQTRGAGLVPQTHPQPGSPTSVLSLRYRPIHIPGPRSGACLSFPARPLCAMGGPRVLLAALWVLGAAGAAALRIGAFNIQSFGDSKVLDPACGGVIAQILAGYDISLVQEVRDPDLSAVSALMEQINSLSRHEYSFVSSEPLGRDQYKEMYLFVYRKDAVSVVDTYQYPDPEDAFSREPFVVKFSAPRSAAGEFVLIPLHAAPHQAVAEIDALYDVYLDVIDKWGTDDLLFLGDFNADCNYVRERDWPSVRLRSSEVFKWLIPDSADTTVGNSDCAYDRIVACGAHLRRNLKPHSAAALAISDHFPVEVTLKSH